MELFTANQPGADFSTFSPVAPHKLLFIHHSSCARVGVQQSGKPLLHPSLRGRSVLPRPDVNAMCIRILALFRIDCTKSSEQIHLNNGQESVCSCGARKSVYPAACHTLLLQACIGAAAHDSAPKHFTSLRTLQRIIFLLHLHRSVPRKRGSCLTITPEFGLDARVGASDRYNVHDSG